MGRWVAVVGADHDLELAQHAVGFFLALAQDGESTDAFTVQAEALAEAGRDEEGQARCGELGHRCTVFLQAVTKALVSHVEERHQATRLDGRDHLVPLGGCDVVAGRVVAAGVQHGDGAGRRRVQVSQHAVEVDAAQGWVVIAVVFDHKTGVGEQGAVVLPAWVADQDLGIGVEAFQKIRAQLEPAGASNGLHRGHAARLDRLAVGPEHQRLDARVVGRNAIDRQVTPWGGFVHHGLFGGLHAG